MEIEDWGRDHASAPVGECAHNPEPRRAVGIFHHKEVSSLGGRLLAPHLQQAEQCTKWISASWKIVFLKTFSAFLKWMTSHLSEGEEKELVVGEVESR